MSFAVPRMVAEIAGVPEVEQQRIEGRQMQQVHCAADHAFADHHGGEQPVRDWPSVRYRSHISVR